MKNKNIIKLLEDYKLSRISIEQVLDYIKKSEKILNLDFAQIDLYREQRTLIPEIIYCENKTIKQILSIIKNTLNQKDIVIGTRCSEEKLKKIKSKYPEGKYSFDGRAFYINKKKIKKLKGKVALISAGSTDIPVCEEAAIVLEALGVEYNKFFDIGVAGIHRLFSKAEEINRCDVLIVAAGMEGALPSVIGGIFSQPIIAIPTSIGYGTALNGFTALFAMLTSCSPGVTVVNINNGVGAAAAAIKILNLLN